MSTLRLIPEEKKKIISTSTSKSMESLYSSSSSNILRRKKLAHKQAAMMSGMSEIRQRVMSARLLSTKHLQNQLSDAQLQISELANENRILRTLHKRQDSALSKYESTKAELPQLLHSHAEEIRSWQSKYKHLQLQNRELNSKIKQKDAALLVISDQNKHLIQLNKDKTLEDREKLTERVKHLELRLMEKDNDTKLLARRLQLETKNFKTQIMLEHQKFKDVSLKYDKANMEVARLTGLFETIEKNKSVNSFSRSYVNNIKSIRQQQKEQKPNPFISTSTLNIGNNNSSIYNSTTTLNSNIMATSSLPLQVITEKAAFNSVSEVIEPRQTKIPIHSPYKEKFTNRLLFNEKQLINDDDKQYQQQQPLLNRKNVVSRIKSGISQILENSISSEENGNQYSDDDNYEEKFNEEHDDDDDADVIESHHTYNTKDTGFENQNIMKSERTSSLESTSTPDDVTVDGLTANFNNINASLTGSNALHDFETFKNVIRDEIISKEHLLDSFCERATTDAEIVNKNSNKYNKSKFDFEAKKNMDPKKKTKLLAALKAIDSNESYDS